MLFVYFFLSCVILFVEITSQDVYTLNKDHGLGRRFDGIGAISGGGATSRLLVNYPQVQRDQVLDYLFKPNFGASLQILKVEIGGDVDSTEGTESSHMHESWDENYHRGYEWWMMKEAKKRNPAIKISGLPWGFPSWVADGEWWPYKHPNRTADYITRWVRGAKKVHGLDIDYIGIWNEKPYDKDYVKALRQTLTSAGFGHVQLVVADLIGSDSWDVTMDLGDAEFNHSVDIIGGHYSGTWSTDAAKLSGKPLWSSEDWSSFNNDWGGGCFARIINKNYVNGRMTSTIAWNLISSYYDNLPISKHGLMQANEPWTGHYEVCPPIWAAAHTTQFTAPGWHYLQHGSGVGYLHKGGSYVSLISPDHSQLTIIIETMDTSRHDFCVRVPEVPYPAAAQNITLSLTGKLAGISSLHVWHSKFGVLESPSVYFKYLGQFKVVKGTVHLAADINSVYTLTTVAKGYKGETAVSPPTKPFPFPYKEDFEAYREFGEPNNFAQQVGVYEVRRLAGRGQVLQQVMIKAPIHWCPMLQSTPLNVIGNYNWSAVRAEVDVSVPQVNGTDGVFLALHVDNGGCYTILAEGVYFFLYIEKGVWELTRDLAQTQSIASGHMILHHDTWYTVSLQVKNMRVQAIINNQTVYNKQVRLSSRHGFIGLGTSTFGLAHYDNFSVHPAS